MDMFCYQCQETAKGQGCTTRGVCGKPAKVAALQDLLIDQLKGLAAWAVKAHEAGIDDPAADLFATEALFATITNANFDPERFVALIHQAVRLRDELRARVEPRVGAAFVAGLPASATWMPVVGDQAEFEARGAQVGIQADPGLDPDVRSLRELLIYGLKGLAAYTHHAYVLDHQDPALFAFIFKALALTTDPRAGVGELVAGVLQCGEMGVTAMALLDGANTATYGNPEITQVNLGVVPGPAILVSGHDLRDLDELLQQTAGKGINVYTHGEMLPANAYPGLKKYPHLVGNYGGSWWHQDKEFESFGGAILMTTNCITPVKHSYAGRIFTTGLAGWPGATHIPDRHPGQQKDFAPVIAAALAGESPRELETGTLTIGFAHDTVLGVADKVVEAVKSGAIKRFVVMAGCDGRHKSRQYYTDVAAGLPDDNIILTAGCAKYRYNKLDLGTIGGLPRVLDAGQCNDSYSLVVIALKLAEVFGVQSVNDLPIAYDIAWYEQKAVIVLLALLSLGVKHIRLGPSLPAFVSPGVLKVLVEQFDIKPIGTVEQDIAAIVAGQ